MSQGIQNTRILNIDVVYTKLGRFYKSINSPDADITKWALSDDGVNYELYNDNLPDADKAKIITNTPQFSAWTDESSLMRNKLLTLPRSVEEVATMQVTPVSLVFRADNSLPTQTITQTVNINTGFKSPNGFVVTLQSANYLYINEQPRPTVYGGSYGSTILQWSRGIEIRGDGRFTQTVNVRGRNAAPAVISFDVTYSTAYKMYRHYTPLLTKIIVESVDRGYKEEISASIIKV